MNDLKVVAIQKIRNVIDSVIEDGVKEMIEDGEIKSSQKKEMQIILETLGNKINLFMA